MRSTAGETEKEQSAWGGRGIRERRGETSSRQTANLARTMVCFSTLNTSTRCNFDSPFCNNDCLTLCFRSQFQLNLLQTNIMSLELFLLLSHFYSRGIFKTKRFEPTKENFGVAPGDRTHYLPLVRRKLYRWAIMTTKRDSVAPFLWP